MTSPLTLLAGPKALELLRERGLHAEDVDVMPGASGGPKWLVLAGLDRFLFGHFFRRPRQRPLHLIGSSIGSWRLACLAQADPLAALDRFEAAYLAQTYPHKASAEVVSKTSGQMLDELLGTNGEAEILNHPFARLHVITARCRGLLASGRPAVQSAGLAIAAIGNALHRRGLGAQVQRVLFEVTRPGENNPFAMLRDLPTHNVPLDRDNLRPAIRASGAVPLVLSGVHIPGAPPGTYRDGGLTDYHLDLDFGPGTGMVLYPHFYPHIVPGWFDKSLRWRRGSARNLQRTLLVAPSEAFIASLPAGQIPDRKDFYRLSDTERVRRWRAVLGESARLADAFAELCASGRIADHVRPI